MTQQGYSADSLQFYSTATATATGYGTAATSNDYPHVSAMKPSNSMMAHQPPPPPHSSSFGQYDPARTFVGSPFGSGGYSDEPPLCEELGVNFSHIKSKSLSVINVLKVPDAHIMDDTDLAGPIFFCLLYGFFLIGKVQFGYIYGVATLGSFAIYVVLNLMSESGVDGYRTVSVLGYSLLPMVILSGISILLKLTDAVGVVLSVMSVVWCTYAASTMFVTVLGMKDQRLLVGYPIGLLYTCFALLTVF